MKLVFFLFLLFSFCKPADPNYRSKPLQNTDYTGFISRNFFQAVVEVPLTKEELTILEERKSCQREALKKRDGIVLLLLKKIAMEDNWNRKERDLEKERASDTEKAKLKSDEFKKTLAEAKSTSTDDTNTSASASASASIFDKKINPTSKAKNPILNRGEFAWFLDTMFIYKEDYSNPEKCSFVFRNIQDKLYERVEKTKLTFIGEDPPSKFKPADTPQNPTSPTGTTGGTSLTPNTTGLPQPIR